MLFRLRLSSRYGVPSSARVALFLAATTAFVAPEAGAGEEANEARKPEATRGALSASVVFERAAATSFSAKAQEAALVSAAARVDAAWATFLPHLSGSASYRRLSNLTPPSFGGFQFPIVLDNYALQATISIPISDYFLRINQNYSAATGAREAARYDIAAARAKSGTEGELAYYSWIRAQRALVVAKLALSDQQTHLKDANNLFSVGTASKADVLRAETAVAAAELQLERTKNLVDLTQKQVQLAIHAGENETLATGESADQAFPPFAEDLKALAKEARDKRPELRSLVLNAQALKKQSSAALAGAFPSLSAYGTGLMANPNQRKFPISEEWFGTWELGAQLSWSPNDILTATAGRSELKGRVAQLNAQEASLRDGIELEVTQAYQAVKEAEVAIETTKRQLASAEEAYRVAHELFVNGRATSTTLTDAETELTRARLENVNASVDAKVARVRLRHAVGRDVDLSKVSDR